MAQTPLSITSHQLRIAAINRGYQYNDNVEMGNINPEHVDIVASVNDAMNHLILDVEEEQPQEALEVRRRICCTLPSSHGIKAASVIFLAFSTTIAAALLL